MQTNLPFISKGNKSGKTIIFIHGNSSSASCWTALFNEHALQPYNLIAMDLPGHGKAMPAMEPTATYSFGGLTEAVIEFIRQLDLKRPVLVGHSLGGHIAIQVAEQVNLAGLAVFGTPPLGTVSDISTGFNASIPQFGYLLKGDLSDNEAGELASVLTATNQHLPHLKEEILNTSPDFRHYFGQSINPETLKNELEILRSAPCPFVLIHGSQDLIVNGEYLNSISKGLRIWEERVHQINAGHFVQLESPAKLASLLHQFMQTLPG